MNQQDKKRQSCNEITPGAASMSSQCMLIMENVIYVTLNQISIQTQPLKRLYERERGNKLFSFFTTDPYF